jgi:hypothetical protein
MVAGEKFFFSNFSSPLFKLELLTTHSSNKSLKRFRRHGSFIKLMLEKVPALCSLLRQKCLKPFGPPLLSHFTFMLELLNTHFSSKSLKRFRYPGSFIKLMLKKVPTLRSLLRQKCLKLFGSPLLSQFIFLI